MEQRDLLLLLKADLGLLDLDIPRQMQLENNLQAAISFIAREGVKLAAPYTAEDAELIVMYASYLYRKRAADDAPMPRMLRWALNNRIFGGKAGGGNAV